MFRISCFVVAVTLTSCVSVHEAAGDKALKEGNRSLAVSEYEKAIGDTPMMDFEYERLRDKRAEILEGEWGPKVREALLAVAGKPRFDVVKELLQVRQKARAEKAPMVVMKRLDAALAEQFEKFPPASTSETSGRIDELLNIFRQAQQLSADLPLLKFIAQEIDANLKVGLPAVPSQGGAERLTRLLDWRQTFRDAGFSAETDALLNGEFAKLKDPNSFTISPLTTADRAFEAALLTRNRVRLLNAGPNAVALADANYAAQLKQLLALVDSLEADHHFIRAWEMLDAFSTRVESESPLRERMTSLSAAAVVWHRAEAERVGDGYRKLLHLAVASAFGMNVSARDSQRTSLQTWRTSLAFKPELLVASGCEAAVGAVTSAFSPTGPEGKLKVSITRCTVSQPDSSEQRSAPYTAIEQYTEQVQVQVGVDLVRVQTGSHKEQCSKASSLEGYSWQGLCDVPEYGTKQVPRYEMQTVVKTREVERSVPYTVRIRRFKADINGRASLTWDDGTVLTVPFSGTRLDSYEAYSYMLPGKTSNLPGTLYREEWPASASAAGTFASAASAAGSQLSGDLMKQLKAHRASLARKAGTQSLTTGDEAAAAEAFIQSVLINDTAQAEAATWLTTHLKTDVKVIDALLSPMGTRKTLAATSYQLPGATPWVSKGITRKRDAWDDMTGRYESDVSEVTTVKYQEGILPPNEFVDFHVGIVPSEIQTGALGSRVALQVGFDGHYSVLEMLTKLRYGFAIHDELGLRFTIGISTAEKRDYDKGSESGVALSIDASYSLVAGLRLPWFSVMAGAAAGYQHYAIGDTLAYGFHIEPAARIGLRLFKIKQLILEASGFVGFVPGVPRKNRVALSFPLLGSEGWDLKLTAEETLFQASELAQDGKTRVPLGFKPAHMVGIQLGARL